MAYINGKETFSYPVIYGYEDGKQAEWSAFWDALQNNGGRTNYKNAFIENWNDDIFKPKYDIKPTDASSMFLNSQIVDLTGCLNRQGVVLDTSNCTAFGQTFQSSKVKYIPTLDLRNCTNMYYAFNAVYIETIEKLILSETTPIGVSCQNARALKNIIIEGVIAANASFSSCSNLTVDSIKSIILALKDYSGTTTAPTLTLSTTAWNRIAAEGATSPLGTTWKEYAQLKNWTT